MSKLKRDLTVVTNQLTAYYTKHGLYGKRLRRAVLNDRLFVKHRGHHYSGPISGQFSWVDTPHGHTYWNERDQESGYVAAYS